MIKPSSRILFQKLGNEGVILHLNSDEYFGLDEVGTCIYEVLIKEGSIEKALPILLEIYDVEEAVLRKDIEELVVELKNEKILEHAWLSFFGTLR